MDIRRDQESDDHEQYLKTGFYSSTSIDNLAHARNLRNSILFTDSSRDLSLGQYSSRVDEHEEEDLGESDREDAKKEDETQTKTLKMTASPSLSALSGILNEKSKQAEQKMRSSMIFDTSIQEDDEQDEGVDLRAETSTFMQSPDLIDIDGSQDFTNFQRIAPATKAENNEQPDFLSTPNTNQPVFDPPTPQVEPTPSNSPSLSISEQKLPDSVVEDGSSGVNTGASQQSSRHSQEGFQNSSSSANVKSSPSPQNILMKQASNVRPSSGLAATSEAVPGRNITPNKDTSAKKKRRSIFSFLKRKPQKSASFVVQGPTSNNTLPTSSTFSVTQQTNKEEDFYSSKLTKKSHSNGNIFGNFRKNKDGKEGTVDQYLVVPKQRSSHTQNLSSITQLPGKRDINKRKPTPLDFEHTLQKQPIAEDENVTDTHPANTESVPDNRSRVDSGEALFPKSLSAQEVESIVSLERSRSVKSNKRNSLSSHRRSLTDNISNNAHNEGMFVTEASNAILSTPDWSKSPTSSILRNGVFESSEESPSEPFIAEESDDPGNFAASNSTQERNTSVNSLEHKINQLKVESSQEDQESLEKNDTSALFTDPDDSEFMSDIMEFASIIDFGEGIDLNLEIKPEGAKYQTLNPSSQRNSYSVHQPDTSSSEPFDFETNPSKSNNSQMETNTRNGSKGTYTKSMSQNSLQSNILSAQTKHAVEGAEEEDDDDDEFEGEDFNQLEEAMQSPSMNGFIPTSPENVGRPLSWSFGGLKAPQFNSRMDISAINTLSTQNHVPNSESFGLTNRSVTFSSRIILYDTYNEYEYDRHPDVATCNQLTPQLAQVIKEELNTLKSEMEIHEDSKCYTHFL